MRRDENKAIHWVACCVFAATLVACGGGSIAVDDPSAGIPSNTSGIPGFDTTPGAKGTGGPLTVTQQGTRVIFTTESGANVVWAVLREADRLIIGWGGGRYVYEHSAAPPTTLQPQGQAGTLVVGGQVAGGAEVGLPNHQISGRIEPHVLVINGLSSSDNTEVEYVFSSCDQTLCENGLTNAASKTIATNVPVDFEGSLRATFAKEGSAGQIMFTVARTDVVTSNTPASNDSNSGSGGGGYDYDDTPASDDTSGGSGGGGSMDSGEQTGGNQDSGGSGNTTTPPAQTSGGGGGGSDNDWIWWVVGGAALLGGGYLLGDALGWWDEPGAQTFADDQAKRDKMYQECRDQGGTWNGVARECEGYDPQVWADSQSEKCIADGGTWSSSQRICL